MQRNRRNNIATDTANSQKKIYAEKKYSYAIHYYINNLQIPKIQFKYIKHCDLCSLKVSSGRLYTFMDFRFGASFSKKYLC